MATVRPEFTPGIELARSYYAEVVHPLVGDVPHAAARVGWGSDVLGYDTERSTDHGWGLWCQLFVEREHLHEVDARLEAELPESFRGWPTRFGWDAYPVEKRVEVHELGDWLVARLGFDARAGIDLVDWLATPQQLLLEVTRGAVFHDGIGDLEQVRAALHWYPDDVWLWLLACQWRRLDQEEPFVGRTAEVGDELGSRVLAARLARDLMRLALLYGRRYAPYSKWLGTAFARLEGQEGMRVALERATAAESLPDREEALVEAFRSAAGTHNVLGVTERVSEEIGLFHSRPFRVLGSGRFAEACLARVESPALRALPWVGSVDQWVDSTDVLSKPENLAGVRAFYGCMIEEWRTSPSRDAGGASPGA